MRVSAILGGATAARRSPACTSRAVSSTVYRRRPQLGRTFEAGEFEGAASITSRQASSGEPVIVLSYRLWRTLGADPAVVGRTISVEGRDWRVIWCHAGRLRARRGGFWAPWDMRVSYRGPAFFRTDSLATPGSAGRGAG
jgi:hypothetical protein